MGQEKVITARNAQKVGGFRENHFIPGLNEGKSLLLAKPKKYLFM